MRQLQQAIFDRFKTDAALFALADDGIYMDQAPQEDLSNYIVVHLISLVPDEVFDYTRRLEVARIQFSIFSRSPSSEKVCEIYDLLVKVYDRATLPFRAMDFQSIMMRREMATLVQEENGFWHYAVDYLIMAQPVTTTTGP